MYKMIVSTTNREGPDQSALAFYLAHLQNLAYHFFSISLLTMNNNKDMSMHHRCPTQGYCLFVLILYVPINNFSVYRDGPSCVDSVLSRNKFLVQEQKSVPLVRLKPEFQTHNPSFLNQSK